MLRQSVVLPSLDIYITFLFIEERRGGQTALLEEARAIQLSLTGYWQGLQHTILLSRARY